jgi:hypothetical protein
MIIRCKDIINLLSSFYDHELEEELQEMFLEHIYECQRCLALFNTFEKALELFHSIEKPVKLERKKKQEFHRWLRVEIRRVVIKKYRHY